ncbi:sulfotransferase [Leptospira sp. 201903070]|uniref:Sulfotransferase n=1 Tax=Leptospira ainlahdjerensis TaxID=2810033 RepID=A0ABS2UAY1_9LEPT|nr:sulfotransferase [Leptospira ainlahdjerensis]MBM9577329.1 sulfotransferase [Leptospira ainlahdjerensis]
MIFVSGMFRSGTTFFARLLNKTKEVSFASDPFFAVFKDFRNTLSRDKKHLLDPNAPLEDYYFDEEKNSFFHDLQNTPFSELNIPDLAYLKKFTEVSSQPYSELLSKRIPEIAAKTYGEFLKKGAALILETYGSKQVAGFKEVWANEFVPHIIELFGEKTKIIQIVRDPRAIAVSNFYSEGRYPLLFLGRQWRKLASLSYHYSKKYQNVLTVKYEDLIGFPEKTVRDLCTFLEIEFNPSLLDTNDIKDGNNQRWTQNSTFQEGGSEGFNQKSIHRWMEKIDPKTRKAIEFLTYPEMQLMGYSSFEFSPSENLSYEILEDEKEKLAKWILPYSEFDFPKEFEKEKSRLESLNQKIEPKVQKSFFLFGEIYEACKSLFEK